MATITNTYVESVNGLTGNLGADLGGLIPNINESGEFVLFAPEDNRHRHLILDAGDIRYTGNNGDTITEKIQELAAAAEPALLISINDGKDYILSLKNGIPLSYTN